MSVLAKYKNVFYFIVFCFPFLLWEFTINQAIDYKSVALIFCYAVANGLLFSLVGLILSFIPKKIFVLSYATIFFVAAYTIVLMLLMCKLVLGIQFSPLVLTAFLDTTKAESIEYITSHLSIKAIILSIALLIVLYFFFKKFIQSVANIYTTTTKLKLWYICPIIIFYTICILKNDVLYSLNMFNEVGNAYKDYNDVKKAMQQETYQSLNTQKQFTCYKINNDTSAVNFILVIGESHSRNHSGIYGYKRNTNPLLSKIANSLLVFNNTISPANTTVLSLQKMLSFATVKDNKPLLTQPHILDLFNKVGFETWWISNQQVSGIHDTWNKLFAKKATHQYFINLTNSWNNFSFDESLFPYFDTAISSNAKNKFIVLHLIGSHERADRRYTGAYNIFNNVNDLPDVSKQASLADKLYINSYDNSIAYNDFIIHSLIEKSKQLKQKTCLLYISDHGEELCEETDFRGHNEGAASRYMCEIPFIVWMNDDYKKDVSYNDFLTYNNRAFQSDQLLHSILDLCNMRTEMYDSTKSIFSKYFIPSKRYVNGVDYDSLFKK